MKKAAFLDRDGVINIDRAYVHTREEFDWVPGVLEGARALRDAGYLLVVVTNQSGIGRGYYSEEDFLKLTAWMKKQFAAAGAPLSGVYFCPHHPEKALPPYRIDCSCRKPKPGMLLRAADELGIALGESIMFGDKPSDMTAGRLAGCPERVLLGTDGKALPELSPDATRAFRNLAEAAASPWFKALGKGEHS
jgi:D-glycero-D-manno-heptose 1,7-bisphosphate phosphatase